MRPRTVRRESYGDRFVWVQGLALRRPYSRSKIVANVDTTLLLGVSPEDDLIVGLDPNLYNPLPMGISFYAQASTLDIVNTRGWEVWERKNLAGSRRAAPRAQEGLETMAAFRSDRLMSWADFRENPRTWA